jgi:ribosomal protein S3AE
MYSLDFVGFKLEFNSLEELVRYCQMTFYDREEIVTKDGKSIGVKVKEFYIFKN